MARKDPYRPPAPPPRAAEPALPRIQRDGPVHRLYLSIAPAQRQAVLRSIGLKHAQRVGHRHKVPELRMLRDLDAEWGVIDEWLSSADGVGGSRAAGDLFDPLIRGLIDRARELLGDHADEPTADQLGVMAEALASERSDDDVRVLLAAVVEFDFAAAPAARELASGEPRFSLPEPTES